MLKEMAIEHERCVMERHKEALLINECYISLLKESCKQNECYCEPPCETAVDTVSERSFSAVIAQARNRRKEDNR
jgi:hypothetical protein